MTKKNEFRQERVVGKKSKLLMHYRCLDENGVELESTFDDPQAPEVTIGKQDVLEAIEAQLIGMKAGDKKTFTLEPEDAFGFYDDDNVEEIPPEKWQLDEPPAVGLEVEILFADDDVDDDEVDEDDIYYGVVIEVNDGVALVDFNHPHAGKKLTFEVEVVKVF